MGEQIVGKPLARSRTHGASSLPAWLPIAAVIALAGILVTLDPIVFVGGGNDDFHYLRAASCFADQGFCPALDHWWSRLPLVAPLGAAVAAFGTGKAALALVPAIYAAAALALLVALVQRQFGRLEALIAGTAFVATPAISQDLVRVAIDLPELCYLLAATFAVQQRTRAGTWRWSLLAGVALGLAIDTRSTSLAAVPIFAVGLAMLRLPLRDWLGLAAGALAIIGAHAALDVAATGDALHHWRLQLTHTRIGSSELSAAAAASGPPIFNLAIIDAWPPAAGVALHWTVEPVVNLLIHPIVALTLVSALLLLAAGLPQLRRADRHVLLFLVLAAALWFGALVYALAIDPKPRMFGPVTAVAAVCIGVLATQRVRAGSRLLPGLCLGLILGWDLLSAYNNVSLEPATNAAAAEIAQRPAGLAVEPDSAKFLAHVPGIERVPSDGDPLLVLGIGDCATAARRAGLQDVRLIQERRFERREIAPIAALRGRVPVLPELEAPVMCLFRRG